MSTCRWFLIATSLFDTARSLPAVGPEITTNDLPFYYPQVSQQIIAQAGDVAAFGSKRLLQTPGLDVTDFDVGQQEIMDRLGLSAQDFVITNSYTDSAKVHHIYASEMVNGIIVDNHNCGAHVQNGSVIAYSTSFTSSQANLVKRSITVAPANPQISRRFHKRKHRT